MNLLDCFKAINILKDLMFLSGFTNMKYHQARKFIYPRYTVDYRPEKDEPFRTRITAGGNLLDFFGNTTTHSASIETIKCHWQSVLSAPGARYCTADISNMYLCSLLPDSQ